MRVLNDMVSGRVYVLDDAGNLRQVSPWPVDKGLVQRLIVGRLVDGQLQPDPLQPAHRAVIARLNATYFQPTPKRAA